MLTRQREQYAALQRSSAALAAAKASSSAAQRLQSAAYGGALGPERFAASIQATAKVGMGYAAAGG